MNPVALWETKLWLNDRFAQLADRLIETYGVCIVFTGGPADRKTIDTIRSMMANPAANLAGETRLPMLAAVYQQAFCLVTTDTGPMHLAAAMQTSVVALFGPTAPWRTGPFGKGHRVVRTAPSCSPCFKRRCDQHRCRCMTDMSVDMVFSAIEELFLREHRK
jgi:3-deoxy-D-manno-octulosonic-acid transferase/heptosyltransferase-1